MLEIKITIEATELANALNNLSAAIGNSKVSVPVVANDAPVQAAVPAPAPAPVSAPAPTVPVAPTAPVAAAPTNFPAPSVPLAAPPKYTVDQIMAAGATLMDAGKVNELMNLLHSFGVQAVMDLKPEQLGAFATAMRELGAKI